MRSFLIICSLYVAFATIGVDVSQLMSLNTATCLHNAGYQFVIARGYCSYGGVDPNCAHTLDNAKSAGIAYRDAYFFPCSFKKSARSQVDEFYNGIASQFEAIERGDQQVFVSDAQDDFKGFSAGYYPGWENDIDLSVYSEDELKGVQTHVREVPEWRKETLGKKYGMVWVDVETNPSSGCGWSRTHAEHCQFLKEIVTELKNKGLNVGVYASNYMWQTVMGSQTACQEIASIAPHYWYAHYDGVQSFSDFIQTGGWHKPDIKQYRGDVSACSMGIDQNFY